MGVSIVGLLAAFVLVLLGVAGPSISRLGPAFLYRSTWDPAHGVFGAAPAILGTLTTSALALILAVPVALGVALFQTEFAPPSLRRPLAAVVDLSAAVPSVVWGFWAILFIAPFFQSSVEPALAHLTGGLGPFAQPPTGYDVLTASLVLAIMILPTVAAIGRSALAAVPRGPREAARALGATRSEVIGLAVLRPARSGITAGVLLGFARASGEAIVVVSLIGNIYASPTSLFSQGETIAGEILNDLNSGGASERGALVELGLLLLVLTVGVQLLARWVLRWSRRPRAPPAIRARGRSIAPPVGPIGPSPLGAIGLAADPALPIGGPSSLPGPRARRNVRRARLAIALVLTVGAVVLAIVPLISVLGAAVSLGGPAVVRPSFYTNELPPACPAAAISGCPIGGIGPAIQGTALLLGLAALVAVPVGLVAGIYLSEYGRGRLGGVVRLATDLWLGVPSVLIGLFVVVLLLGRAPALDDTALAGAGALSLLMIPITARATEEALRAVPASARESALALGFPRHRTTLRVVLPSARGGLITGIFLAMARAGGETAAVVLAAFGSPYWFTGWNHPIAALPLVIFQQGSQSSYPNWQADAWGAALVLLVIMLGLSLLAQTVARTADPADTGG